MSTSVLKDLPGKLDIKRHSPCILYLSVARLFAQGDRLKQVPARLSMYTIFQEGDI